MWRWSGRGCTVMPCAPAATHNSAARNTLGIPTVREFRSRAILLTLTLSRVICFSMGSGLSSPLWVEPVLAGFAGRVNKCAPIIVFVGNAHTGSIARDTPDREVLAFVGSAPACLLGGAVAVEVRARMSVGTARPQRDARHRE